MIELYHFPPSTCSQKVRLVLAEKGLSFTPHMVDLSSGGQHAPDYVKLNPNHVVPTLIHDGNVLVESTLICEYLEDAFPEPPLLPEHPVKRHAARLWTQSIDHLHAHASALTFAIGPRRMIIAQGPAAVDANVAQMVGEKARASRRSVLEHGIASPQFQDALEAFVIALDRMETALGAHPWLAGDAFTLADAAALPYVLRVDHLSMTPLIEGRPQLADWYARVQDRQSYDVAVARQLSPMVQVMRAGGAEVWPEIADLVATMAKPVN